MIKLPKKIAKVISNESIVDYTCLKHVYVDSPCVPLRVHLYALRCKNFSGLIILRYFGDGSYNFFGGFSNMDEVVNEFSNQVSKLM